MYEYTDLQVPVVSYHHITHETKYNSAFSNIFGVDKTELALSMIKDFICTNIQNRIALPYAHQIYIDDCNYICIHFAASSADVSMVILANLAYLTMRWYPAAAIIWRTCPITCRRTFPLSLPRSTMIWF